jgi:LacI family transcriptional regulator
MEVPASREQARQATPRVTISELSRAVGLNKSTVSRAMNGYADISEGTRLRVTRMAERMGYQPLSQAQAIRTGRTRTIGFVIQMGDHDSHRPFLADFLAGASHAASLEGWTLTVAVSEDEPETLEVMRTLVRDRKADGFILPRTRIEDSRVMLLRDMGVPFVMFGRTGDSTDCAWHDCLGEVAMAGAVARLAALGHRRIGFVNGGSIYYYSILRRQGFLDGMAAAGLTADPALIDHNALMRTQGRDAALALLQSPEPPTALVYAVDSAAFGLYDVAESLGLSIGRHVSVISYDGLLEGAWVKPGLSTYSVDRRSAGAGLGRMLLRRLRGERPEDLRETFEAQFLDRGSAGPPALTSSALAARVAANRH